MDVRLPDGTIIRDVPDGTTREQLAAKLKANGYSFDEPKAEKPKSDLDTLRQATSMATPAGLASSLLTEEGRRNVGNAAAGAVRGAGSIGATLLYPIDKAMDVVKGDRGPNVSSLVTGQKPLSRNEERRQQMDAALQGMGADTDSLMYQGGKIGAEVAGTMGVGGVAANTLGRVVPGVAQAAPGFINALRSGGMTTGVRAAPGVVPQAVNLGTRVAGGAINGGLAAGLINPEDAGLGAAIGGAIPVVTRAAGAAGRVVGNAVSPRMARNNATQKVASTLGDDVSQAVADIQTHLPRGAEDIPLSAAAITKNPRLAQMEQGSRLNSSPAWYEFDQRQGKAVFDNVMKATGEAGELGSRLGQRQDNWREAWEKAAANQKPRLWQQRMTKFGGDLETALRSPDASNPNVRGVLEAINAEFDRVGPNFSPAHLQQLRANLNGKVQPLSPDVFKSAPRDNPAIKSLIAEMDDILNVSTGGKWQKVLGGYAKDSDSVRAAKAASKVRGSFVDADTGRIHGVALNADVPKITEAGLGRALDAARLPDKSLALSPQASNRLMATLDALRAQNVVQGVKRSATAGGGSDTIPNAIAAEAAQRAGAPNMLLQLLGAVKKMGTAKTDNELAKLLADPDELARVLEAFNRPQNPNRLAMSLYRSAPALAADR